MVERIQGTGRLLQAQQYEELTLSPCKWLQRFPDQRTRPMNPHSADFKRNGFHGYARDLAGYQQVADRNWPIRRVYLNSHPPSSGDEHTACSGLTQREPG